jgi:hypothetical protein
MAAGLLSLSLSLSLYMYTLYMYVGGILVLLLFSLNNEVVCARALLTPVRELRATDEIFICSCHPSAQCPLGAGRLLAHQQAPLSADGQAAIGLALDWPNAPRSDADSFLDKTVYVFFVDPTSY